MLKNLNKAERAQFAKLSNYKKIQDFLDALPHHDDHKKAEMFSPRRVIRECRAHCIEGALVAATALWFHGAPPLLMDLRASKHDDDHVVALYRRKGLWGALSKTQHLVLRFREPVYKTPRELALSYFNEYYLDDGTKTLRSFSKPFDLRKVKRNWLTTEDDLGWLAKILDASPHIQIVPKDLIAQLRKADKVEIEAGKLTI